MVYRTLRWLVVAILLFAAAAWLMSRPEKGSHAHAEPRVTFPRSFRGEEWRRMTQRQTLEESPSRAPGSGEPAAPPGPRDPLLAALPREPGTTVVVVEANALANSSVGQLLLACVRHEEQTDLVESMKKEIGIDPMKDLDRIAVSTHAVLVSGQLKDVKWSGLLAHMASAPYGDKGTIYSPDNSEGQFFARWGDNLAVISKTEQDARAAIDRIEGRARSGAPLAEEDTYGEIYGVIATDLLRDMVGRDSSELAQRIEDTVQQARLHVSAMNDVAIVADVRGADSRKVQDLAKSLGAALSLARLKAQTEGQTDLADLLDLARVEPRDGSFVLELALPQEFLEKKLASCRESRAALDAGH